MSVHFCVIARDSDMVVFETLVNKDMNQRQLRSEAIEVITHIERENEALKSQMIMNRSQDPDLESQDKSMTWCEALTRITGKSVELNVLL